MTQLGTIGATGPGAASEQIFKFLVKKPARAATVLKFVYIGAPELPASLMNNVIDAYALLSAFGRNHRAQRQGLRPDPTRKKEKFRN